MSCPFVARLLLAGTADALTLLAELAGLAAERCSTAARELR